MALNGQFTDTMLAYLGWPEADHLRLVPDAAASLNRLAIAFEAHFGKPLYLSDAYRTLAEQKRLKITKGAYAASPGTSNHGWGLAIDMASRINVDGSDEHRWMEAYGPYYGWINPWWAENYIPRDGQHEPWHWEFHSNLDHSADNSPPTPTPTEDDMPTTQEVTDAVGERVKEILRAPEFQGYFASDAHKIAAYGMGPAPVDTWLADTRVGVMDVQNTVRGLVAQVSALQATIAAISAGAGTDPAALIAAAKAGARAALADLTLSVKP